MENLDNIMQEIRDVQGGVNEVLRDTLGDYKEREAVRERRDFRKDVIIIVLILALVGSFIFYQWNFRSFLEQYEFAAEITVEGTEAPAFYQKGEGNTITNGAGESSSAIAPQG